MKKICPECGNEFEGRKDKVCCSEHCYKKQYNAQHREHRLEYDKQYKAQHREQIREYDKQYKAQHREQIRERSKPYRYTASQRLNSYKQSAKRRGYEWS